MAKKFGTLDCVLADKSPTMDNWGTVSTTRFLPSPDQDRSERSCKSAANFLPTLSLHRREKCEDGTEMGPVDCMLDKEESSDIWTSEDDYEDDDSEYSSSSPEDGAESEGGEDSLSGCSCGAEGDEEEESAAAEAALCASLESFLKLKVKSPSAVSLGTGASQGVLVQSTSMAEASNHKKPKIMDSSKAPVQQPSLQSLLAARRRAAREHQVSIQTTMPRSTFTDQSNLRHPHANTNPSDCLKEVYEANGLTATTLQSQNNNNCSLGGASSSSSFLDVTPERVADYDLEVAAAARSGDTNAMRRLFMAGKNLQCCNKFGESLVHIACRRGHDEILMYLLDHANVSVRVCCDTGRTPLHDACWTRSPNFEAIRLLLEDCPELLLVADKRGFTPLSYIPRDCWGQWCDFLIQNQYLVLPHVVVEVERFL